MTCSNVTIIFEDFTTLLAFKRGETEFINWLIGVENDVDKNKKPITKIEIAMYSFFINYLLKYKVLNC